MKTDVLCLSWLYRSLLQSKKTTQIVSLNRALELRPQICKEKAVLQTEGVQFERWRRFPGREGLIENATDLKFVGSSMFGA